MKYIFFSIIMLFGGELFSQNMQDSINWLSIEDVRTKFAEHQKPVMFYFYKQDCDSCREQEKTTFSNPEVANYINVLFYPVKIDAYSQEEITFFDGKKYIPHKKLGEFAKKTTHPFAKYLLGGIEQFPTFVLFNRQANGIPFQGFKDRDEMFRLLIYYAENIDASTSFEDWYKYHKKGYPPGLSQIMTRLKVNWKTLEEVAELNEILPRKTLLNFYNFNKISCNLMRTQTYNQIDIANYLNDKFYTVNIDVFSQDTLEIMGVKYINENKSYKYHQLPIAALEGKMNFPAFIILGEDGKVISKHQEYMTPEKIEKIIHYYGNDVYKKKDFISFEKDFESKLRSEKTLIKK